MGYPWISLYGITLYKSGKVGINWESSALISGIARDIPVSAFFERVIPGYPHVCMLKIAYSGLLNAQIARTAIWISSWKLYFSSAAGGLAQKPPGAARRPRRAQRRRRQLRHHHRQEAWEARRRGGHHSPRLLAQERLTPAAPALSCWTHLL